jgi:uncharacterized damage-inducible protein DinB
MNPTEAASKAAVFVDVERELAVTRNVLAAIPADKFDWKPHEKSMSLVRLAIHVAHLPEWARGALDEDELNFQTADMPPESVGSTAELLRLFDKYAVGFRMAVANFDMERWEGMWVMRDGEQVLTRQPRAMVYRVWCMNHLVSHRAQINLYLRLLNVPVATLYFNSADDPAWKFE